MSKYAYVYDILQIMRESPEARNFIRLAIVFALSTSLLFIPLQNNSVFADTSLIFTPTADSYVDSSLPSNNFGTANPLLASASVRRALLMFNTTLPAGSTVTSVTLRVFSKATSASGGYEIHPEMDTWAENTVTWNTQPAWNATILATSPSPASGVWTAISLPVTSVNNTGITAYGVRFSTSGFNAQFSSREDTVNSPQLVITYSLPSTASSTSSSTSFSTASFTPSSTLSPTASLTLSATPSSTASPSPSSTLSATPTIFQTQTPTSTSMPTTMVFAPSGDSYVDSSLPSNNFGAANPLLASASVRRALLKFSTSVLAGDTINSVSLRLFSKATAASGGYEIHPETDGWLENTVTWNNQPGWNPNILQTSGTPITGTWITIPLPVSSVNTNGASNFGIRFSVSGFNAQFSSREDAVNIPQLIVNYTLPQDPVIAAVGDIECGSQDTGSGFLCQGASTASLVQTMQPTAVLDLGDNQYEQGSLSDYTTFYDPAWGFAKPITKPIPGNHEYGTAGGSGYYTYFGSVASPQESGCTINCKGYYSYDLGNWHLIALNNECGNIPGGCGIGSPEETWLKNDLAQVAPTKCILAYWHEPHFSSGNDGNTSETTVSLPFWQDLYAAGADIILNGHSHDYERFAQQDPSGNATTAGIREFVVGTGGRDFTGWWTNSLVNSQVKNNDTFGALKLILHVNSYDWQFIPAIGIGYTNGIFTDSGSTNCH